MSTRQGKFLTSKQIHQDHDILLIDGTKMSQTTLGTAQVTHLSSRMRLEYERAEVGEGYDGDAVHDNHQERDLHNIKNRKPSANMHSPHNCLP